MLSQSVRLAKFHVNLYFLTILSLWGNCEVCCYVKWREMKWNETFFTLNIAHSRFIHFFYFDKHGYTYFSLLGSSSFDLHSLCLASVAGALPVMGLCPLVVLRNSGGCFPSSQVGCMLPSDQNLSLYFLDVPGALLAGSWELATSYLYLCQPVFPLFLTSTDPCPRPPDPPWWCCHCTAATGFTSVSVTCTLQPCFGT